MARNPFKLTKFYEYNQNNSGGDYVIDKHRGIGETVIIEAVNIEHANTIAQRKGIYFNGVNNGIDCECCGDRWHEPYPHPYNSFPIFLYHYSHIYVHFLDGNIFKLEEVK